MRNIVAALLENGFWKASLEFGFGIVSVYGNTEQEAIDRLNRLMDRIEERNKTPR